jgi:hypothetical protein
MRSSNFWSVVKMKNKMKASGFGSFEATTIETSNRKREWDYVYIDEAKQQPWRAFLSRANP